MVTRFALLAVLVGCAQVAGLDEFVPDSDAAGGAPVAGAPLGGAASGAAPPIGGSPDVGGNGAGTPDSCASDLLIAEVRTYGIGNGDDDFLEIFNPTDTTRSLAEVSMWAYKPSNGSPTERWHGEPDDEILPGGRFVLGGLGFSEGNADATLGVGESIGDSQIVLLRRGPNASPSTIDHVCICTDDCGQTALWGGCPGVLPNPAYESGTMMSISESLARKPDCVDEDEASDFTSGLPTPGAVNEP